MSAIDDVILTLPIDQIAARIGEDPSAVQQAVHSLVPALFGGLEANAKDPAGEASLNEALGQHSAELSSGAIDVGQVDQAEGEKITRHIFGDNTDQVVQQLGGVSGGSSLVAKLLPILAPIVLSYLAKQMGNTTSASTGGLLSTVLQQILQGAAQGTTTTRASDNLGSILGDVLGGLLGKGTKSG